MTEMTYANPSRAGREEAQPALLQQTTTPIPEAPRPLFLFGCYRSGTSLLRLMLNSHPQIAIPEETVYIPLFGHTLPAYGDLAITRHVERLLDDVLSFLKRKARWVAVPQRREVLGCLPSPATYQDVVRTIALCAVGKGQRVAYWGDKTPWYINAVISLNHLFVDARFINVVRDGRDVAASIKSMTLWHGKTPLSVAEDWTKRVWNGMLGASLIGPDRFLTVRYEELVTSPREVLEQVMEFLRLPFEPAMLAFHQTHEARRLARYPWLRQVAEPVSSRSIHRYRQILTRQELSLFEREAGNTLLALGYEVDLRALAPIRSWELYQDRLLGLGRSAAYLLMRHVRP